MTRQNTKMLLVLFLFSFSSVYSYRASSLAFKYSYEKKTLELDTFDKFVSSWNINLSDSGIFKNEKVDNAIFTIPGKVEDWDDHWEDNLDKKLDMLVFENVRFKPGQKGIRVASPYFSSIREITQWASMINHEIRVNNDRSEYQHLFINLKDCVLTNTDLCQNDGFPYKFGNSSSCQCACRQTSNANKTEFKVFHDSICSSEAGFSNPDITEV